jgi:hypothetical protein
MELVMWVEILARHHHDVAARHRCGGDEISIGRGYDNDIVIDDPHLAARHLRLYRDADGGWVAEDQGTVNGLYTERGTHRVERVALDGDQVIRIGRTLLRLRPATWPVAAERVETRQWPLWPAAIILGAGIIGIEVGSNFLAETGDPRPLTYLAQLQNLMLTLLGWVGFWTVLCRVFTGQMQFQRHLLIALTGVFSYSLFDEVLKLAGFAFGRPTVLSKEFVAMWVIVAAVGFGHLDLIAPRLWRVTAAAGAALAILGIITATLTQSEAHRNADPAPAQGRIYPPYLRLRPPQAEAAFFKDVGELRDTLQAKRRDQDK